MKSISATKTYRIVSLPLLLALVSGCAAQQRPATTFDPCQAIEIEPAPLWTASAAWTPAEDRLLMIGPGSHSLLVYNLRGELERRVELDAMAALEYSNPIRLQATGDGYFVGDKTQILWLDHDFEKRRLWKPFEHLGMESGSISDFTVVGETVYAYADFVSSGNWHRGFVAIDLEKPEYLSLHEFSLEDEEMTDYYFYEKRPYVTDLGRRAYVLRYTDPPTILRTGRRALTPLFDGGGLEDLEVTSLYAWEDRLYLLGWRRAETPAEKADVPTQPELRAGSQRPGGLHADLMALRRAVEESEVERFLVEVDPRSGRALGRYRLPSDSESVKLLPGRAYWALIEESAVPNVDGKESTHLTLLPSSWFQSRRRAEATREVALECPGATRAEIPRDLSASS